MDRAGSWDESECLCLQDPPSRPGASFCSGLVCGVAELVPAGELCLQRALCPLPHLLCADVCLTPLAARMGRLKCWGEGKGQDGLWMMPALPGCSFTVSGQFLFPCFSNSCQPLSDAVVITQSVWCVIVARCTLWLVRWSCKTGLKTLSAPSSFQWLLLWLKGVAERMGKCLRAGGALLRPAGHSRETQRHCRPLRCFQCWLLPWEVQLIWQLLFQWMCRKGSQVISNFSLPLQKTPIQAPVAHDLKRITCSLFSHLFPLHTHLFRPLNLIKWVTQY